MLRLSGIDELTDDQRDAFCNMGEALGMTGGEAEDIIDEYLEERMLGGVVVAESRPEAVQTVARPNVSAPQAPVQMPAVPAVARPVPVDSPARRAEEKQAHPSFTNSLGMPMLLVTSGTFQLGSAAPGAAPNEQPVCKVAVSAFFLSRWPVTNAQYEEFDPSHRAKRAAWADEQHPVVYVSALDAARFCQWLGAREKQRYRLPAEAEWEYAARGREGRTFPWGEVLDRNNLANFADVNKKLPWAHPAINTGFSETSPVGSFPRGASPFEIEEMAGNVWEWCLDCLAPYQDKARTNPRGPLEAAQRIYRGGSWKSRAGSLRASVRGSNSPAYSANDVGFRVLCEV
jgi:formylglycine-generating enzyme required for sulfatase activity